MGGRAIVLLPQGALALGDLHQDADYLKRAAQQRQERLRNLSAEITSDAIKEKLDVPAYLRRNVALENVAHSSEKNISRFNLSDDSEILGDNRFLHDNVD